MSPRIARLGMVVICVATVVGCWNRAAPRIKPPSIDPSSAASDAMKKYDTDGDGAITGEELEKAPSLSAARVQIDSNEDGKITAREIADRISEWHDSRMGSQTVNCIVVKGGQPLEGATVTFDPEEFLGNSFQAATGTTGKSGTAGVSIPGADPAGVAPGLYLVRITKEGEDIPAKYNTETILGQEVAIDAAALGHGSVTFELE